MAQDEQPTTILRFKSWAPKGLFRMNGQFKKVLLSSYSLAFHNDLESYHRSVIWEGGLSQQQLQIPAD